MTPKDFMTIPGRRGHRIACTVASAPTGAPKMPASRLWSFPGGRKQSRDKKSNRLMPARIQHTLVETFAIIETYWNILKHIETITAMVTPWAGTAVIYGPRDESHVVDASLSIPGPNAIWWPIVGFVGLVWPCFNPPGLASIQQTWNIFFQSATNCGSRLIPFHWYILAVGKHLLTTAAIGTFLGITRGFLCFFYLALVITAKWCKSWTKLYRNI